MPALMIEYRDEAERLGLEQAIAFFTPMRHVAQTAPDGTVLAACEQVALRDGRALLRKSLASAVAAHRRGRAKRGAARAGTGAGAGAGLSQGRHERRAVTAVGPIAGGRRSFPCPVCGQGDFGADRVLGLDGYLTAAAAWPAWPGSSSPSPGPRCC